MDISQQVVSLNIMARKLQKLSANSFTDRADLYRMVTDIMLEANKAREILEDRKDGKAKGFFDNVISMVVR